MNTGVQMVQFPHVFRLGEFSSLSNSAKGVQSGGEGMTYNIPTLPISRDLRVSDPSGPGLLQIKTPRPKARQRHGTWLKGSNIHSVCHLADQLLAIDL